MATCVAMVAGLSACGAPPPLPPTVVNVTLVASADDNPTTDNKGAPLALRVYQLAGSANFASAEFFPLYNSDSATLKTDLLQRDDFLLAPEATKSETIMAKDNVTAIGVFGAYRGFQNAVWHVSFPVAAHQTTNATITAGHDGLVLKTETIAPK
jgi:type VI secretion system protein VasD